MNRDKLTNLDAGVVGLSTLDLLDRLSDSGKEYQGVALAAALLAYAKRHALDVGDLFTVANNMLHSKEVGTPTFIAMQNYIKHET